MEDLDELSERLVESGPPSVFQKDLKKEPDNQSIYIFSLPWGSLKDGGGGQGMGVWEGRPGWGQMQLWRGEGRASKGNILVAEQQSTA